MLVMSHGWVPGINRKNDRGWRFIFPLSAVQSDDRAGCYVTGGLGRSHEWERGALVIYHCVTNYPKLEASCFRGPRIQVGFRWISAASFTQLFSAADLARLEDSRNLHLQIWYLGACFLCGPLGFPRANQRSYALVGFQWE